MKATITFESATIEKLNMLIRIAEAIGIKVMNDKKEIHAYSNEPDVSIVSEPSLAEAWDSEEDNRWDELYAKKD